MLESDLQERWKGFLPAQREKRRESYNLSDFRMLKGLFIMRLYLGLLHGEKHI